MKRILLSVALTLGTIMSSAMPYKEARQHALFLTDKMAYELNLTEHQYNDAYQINLDYFLGVSHPDDVYGMHWRFRNRDMRYILLDWQYVLYSAADYFVQPLLWRANSWFFPILHRYDRAHFYFSHPSVCDHYHGGGHINYVTRRPPKWHGGMMGHEPHGGARPDYNYRHPGNDRPHQPGYMQRPDHGGKPQMSSTGNRPSGNDRPGMGNHSSTPDRHAAASNRTGTTTRPVTFNRPAATTRSSGARSGERGSRNVGRGGR